MATELLPRNTVAAYNHACGVSSLPAKKDKENFGYAQETARPSIVQVLTRERRAFLGFIRKRVRTNEEAEEILQAAYAKGLRHLKTIENNDNTVAWFFRIIRNSLADHWRHEEVKSKALEELAHESAAKTSEIESELEKAVCGCMNGLMKTIKPECAEILQEVDLRDMRLRDFATAGSRLKQSRQFSEQKWYS